MVVVGAVAVFRWRNVIIGRVTHLYWQHRVATFSAPAGTVAYELDGDWAALGPDRGRLPAAQLRHRPGYGPGSADLGGAIDVENQTFPWDHYEPPSTSSPPGWVDACVFCHDRRSASGRRIVHVRCSLGDFEGGLGNWWSAEFVLSAEAWTPAAPWSNEQKGPVGPRSDVTLSLPKRGRLRIDVGQIDPADPSRFAVDVDVEGQRRTIAGRLEDDGTVSLTDPAP